MKYMIDEIREFLEHHTVEFESLCNERRLKTEKSWLQTYAANVKMQTGSWVHAGFMWHGFSYGYERAVEGNAALQKYQNNWPAPFIVFDEQLTWAFRCDSTQYPDFSKFGADIYVAHHNMKWTMVFTHEQPHQGPYFTSKELR